MEMLNKKEFQAFRYIRNCIVHQGRSPSVREVMRALAYTSPNSAAVVIESLIDQGLLRRKPDKKLQLLTDISLDLEEEKTVMIPLVGTAPCGSPILSEENIEARIPVSEKLARPPHNYFLLRASGDSMDNAEINDGDLVLVRQQPTASNGDKVVALVDGESTIKEFQKEKQVILLKPKSTNKSHKPIIATHDLSIQGVVVMTIPNF